MAHSYSWIASSGVWSNPNNWDDLTTLNNPALVAPGGADTITIAGPSLPGFDLIAGPGAAASSILSGDLAFYGALTLGGVSPTPSGYSATIDLEPGAVLSVTSLLAGPLLLDNATLQASGTILPSVLTVENGSTLTAASLTTGAIKVDPTSVVQIAGASNNTYSYSLGIGGTVSVQGVFELGTAGGAAAGVLTVDAGTTASISGVVTSPIVDNGLVTGGSTLFPALSGTGTLDTNSATFTGPVAAGLTVAPTNSATLTLPATGFAGTLSGWTTANGTNYSTGVALVLPRTDITGATYLATGTNTGTLTLNGAAGPVQSLTLVNQAGADFVVLPIAGSTGQTATKVLAAGNVLAAGTTGDLALAGASVLAGTLVANNVTMGTGSTSFYPMESDLAVLAGGALLATTLNLPAGEVSVGAGATFATVGTMSLGAIMIAAFTGGIVSTSVAATLAATRGGSVTIGARLSMQGALATVLADSTSSIEVGADGTATTGGLTIDRTRQVTGLGVIAAAVTNNGSLIATAEISASKYQTQPPNALVVNGALGGTGEDQIGASADLVLNGAVGAGQTIEFTGTAATLDLRGAGLVQASITGFGLGDSILVPSNAAAAQYAGGVLTLTDLSGAVVESFVASGSFAGDTLLLEPTASGAQAVVLLPGTLLAGAPPAPSSGIGGHRLFWSSAYSGSGNFGDAAHWIDETNSTGVAAAAAAPGAGDTAEINGIPLVTGAAAVAVLDVYGSTTFSGSFGAGQFIEEFYTSNVTDVVAPGATLVAGQATVESQLLVSGGRVGVSGKVTLALGQTIGVYNINPPELDARDGGGIDIGGLGGLSFVVTVDAASYFEVGFAGTPAAGTLTVDPGAVVGAGLNTAVPISNSGTIVDAGTITGSIANNGILLGGGTYTGAITGSGHIQAGSGTPMILSGLVGSSQTIDFLGPDAGVALTGASHPSLITGFGSGNVLAITGLDFDTVAYTSAGSGFGTLTLTHDDQAVDSLTLGGSYAGAVFLATPDASGATDITLVPSGASVACFAAGTGIATPTGPVAVEHLRAGDLVRLARGGVAPVVWMGSRRLDCGRHPRPWDVQPVHVVAGAFGPGRPARTLRLSPDHAVFVQGVLVPVRHLINGRTVVQAKVDHVTYFHVELAAHDVLLAEGLPCESYLDTGNRSAFANGGAAMMLHADFARGVWAAQACAELVLEGSRLTAVRRRLRDIATAAGHAITSDPGLRVLADGRSLAAQVVAGRWQVTLPADARLVRLVSRRWTPAHLRPDGTDMRRLGVAVRRLRLDGRDVALDDARLSSGWQPVERGAGAADWRWTDGDAGLALAGVRELEFDLAMSGSYWAPPPRRDEARAAARR